MHPHDPPSPHGSEVSSLHEAAPRQDGSENTLTLDRRLDRERRIFEVQERWNEETGKQSLKERQALLASQTKERQRRQALIDQGVARELGFHSLALGLMFLFAFLALFSWVVTCVLCYRP